VRDVGNDGGCAYGGGGRVGNLYFPLNFAANLNACLFVFSSAATQGFVHAKQLLYL
jgi:hypothetical protein